MKLCPRCKEEMELQIDEEAITHPPYEPTKAYYQCPRCLDCYPAYLDGDEK